MSFCNQISGKEMIARFADGMMSELDVNGNVEVISLPEEKALQKTQRVTKALNIDTPESHTRIYSHDMGCVFKQKCTYGVAMHV